MRVTEFFDTNIVVYAFSDDTRRASVADQLLMRGGMVSVQVLNELASALRRKLQMNWDEVQQAIEDVLRLCPDPVPLSVETHRSALQICARYRYGMYDGLILAAAREAGCNVLYTEDMHHGQVIEGVRIVNPFL